MKQEPNHTLTGLTSVQAAELQQRYGRNDLVPEKKETLLRKILQVVAEPMFLLLLVAATIYFILGEPRDGAIMLIFVVGIIGIEAIQKWRTDKTLKALKELSAPRITVLRDGVEQVINSVDLVPGDILFLAEGVKIPADGRVVRASTLCVDESSLTGESVGVWKVVEGTDGSDLSGPRRPDAVYAGTLVTQGTGTIRVEAIGLSTEYGKIGKEILAAPVVETPLQKQTGRLVRLSGVLAGILFLLVAVLTFFNIPDHPFRDRMVESVLSGITLAMAMIPEEFPVILTVFLSMGAWKLAKKNSLVKRLPSVETLGEVSVLCVDKTGTITRDKMALQETFSRSGDEMEITRVMGMGCRSDAYDPMEQAMLARCKELGITEEELFGGELLKEYAFTDELKMMGNLRKTPEGILVAAKGSPERIFTLCSLFPGELIQIEEKIYDMSSRGLRVIAVGRMKLEEGEGLPEKLTDCRLELLGVVGLADPPRESLRGDLKVCTRAGVRVVMITGDYGITASSIARQIEMPGSDRILGGDLLDALTDEELREQVKTVNIFSRVLPAHKMRIVRALRENGEIVAMTGDGVNDAPALKYADIGIAMGHRGSEVSREAADLILLDDNFSTIVETIRDGRRIHDNIRKAVGYVFIIHIPIALASLMGPFLGIDPASLFLLPLHVVLLELVIDPTCSIVLERQPAEPDIMERPPRSKGEKLLSLPLLSRSLLQGLAVFAASFGTYYLFLLGDPGNAPLARAMGLAILILSNVLLVQVIRSDKEPAFRTFGRQLKDPVMWIVVLGSLGGLLVMLYTPLNQFLKLAPPNPMQLFLAAGISAAAVLWIEVVKVVRKALGKRNGNSQSK